MYVNIVDREASTVYTRTTSQPTDWSTKYTDYYTKTDDTYTRVTGEEAPTWEADTYYVRTTEKGYKYLPSVSLLYTQLPAMLDEIADKGEYSVKYISSGAYPVFEYAQYAEYVQRGELAYPTGSEAVPTTCTFDNKYSSGTTPTTLTISYSYTDGAETRSGTKTFTENGSITVGAATALTVTFTETGFSITKGTLTLSSMTYKATKSSNDLVSAGLDKKMASIAGERGDAVAIIDHANNPVRPLTGSGSVFQAVSEVNFAPNDEFATMFTPWGTYQTVAGGVNVPSAQVMPASFGYLLSLAVSIQTNANWLAIAGVARGLVPYIQKLSPMERLSNKIADDVYQQRTGVAINPITEIKPYGLTIWGNRTLKNNAINLTATSFLNIRNLVSDVKKIAYVTAKRLMFEQNSDILWINFKAGITPLLDQMVSGQGLTGYKIIKGKTSEKGKVVATIRLYPIYAVEDFEITVAISDEEVSVS